MSDLEQLLETARGQFERVDLHRHFSGREDDVASAQVALDTAEDAMLALSCYESAGIGTNEGEKYLRLYGFLQAIVLQQDAICKLHELFVGQPQLLPNSGWDRLRELRNLTTGHPIERGGKRKAERTFMTRVSLENAGFRYQVWHKENGKTTFEEADIAGLYKDYQREATQMLEKILPMLVSLPDSGEP
jgi:hypothetical protein